MDETLLDLVVGERWLFFVQGFRPLKSKTPSKSSCRSFCVFDGDGFFAISRARSVADGGWNVATTVLTRPELMAFRFARASSKAFVCEVVCEVAFVVEVGGRAISYSSRRKVASYSKDL